MEEQQILNSIRQLLHNTYSNIQQVKQSEDALKELSEEEPGFIDVITHIVLNDADINIRKAAIIQTRNFGPENILKLFILFNEKLDPSFHEMITILSDLLADNQLEILYSFCIDFYNEQEDNFDKEGIIQKKTLMIAILSLLNNENTEFFESKEFSNLQELFNKNFEIYVQFIQQILQYNEKLENIELSQQHILFFHYFLNVFDKFLCIQDQLANSELYEFIHFFLCFSLRFKIDFIYKDLNTKIVDKLFKFYSDIFQQLSQNNSDQFLQSFKFDEILDNFEIFQKDVPANNWPVSFFINIHLFFESTIVFSKYHEYSEQIINNYLFPLFSYNFFTNITDDFEFIDLYYPNILSDNLQSTAMKIVRSFFQNDKQEMIYKFAYAKFGEMIQNEQTEEIFGLINMMSYCSFNNEYLAEFCEFISTNLLQIQDPLIFISIMHYLSELPHKIKALPQNFIDFVFAGLFGQIPTETELINYVNIIQYFSVLSYGNFVSNNKCPSFNSDPEKMNYILELAIGFDECFRTEGASSALSYIIDDLVEIDEALLNKLVEIVWQFFLEESQSSGAITSNHIVSLISIFKKCEGQVKLNASEMILNLVDGFLHKFNNSEEDYKIVYRILDLLCDEIFLLILKFVEYLTQVLPDNLLDNLFTTIRDEFVIIFTVIIEDDIEWEPIDKTFLCFVNLKDKINHSLLLAFFEYLIQIIIERNWHPDQLFSLEQFIKIYSSLPDVGEFLQKYQSEIQHIFDIINEEEEEEEEGKV